MGRRKTILKVPKRVKIKCPHCLAISQIELPKDSSPQILECSKCQQKIAAPITQCCVICAFSKKKCLPSLKLEAFSKKLEMQFD